eukprot:PITA_04780
MTKDLFTTLGLQGLRHTPTVLELADRSRVKPEGMLEDIVITIASWRYPTGFLILQSKSNLGGHPLILGRPWLSTADAFIGRRSGSIVISDGQATKNLNLYPPKPNVDVYNPWWDEFEPESDLSLPLLTLGKAQYFKDETEDDVINGFLSNSLSVASIKNANKEEEKYKKAFAWNYTDMKGIHPNLCTHRIYLKAGCKPIKQPERRMNPTLKKVVKEELQKLQSANFIYPISDSQWVSPLVIIPKKNGKWKVCVNYGELNKATQKDHFPLPFIDQVLDTLSGKKLFSFLDGFSGYTQIQIAPKDQDKTTFTCPLGTFAYRVVHFGLYNAPATFQGAILGIFSDLLNDCLEIFMDDFTPYGDAFETALVNLEKVLERCVQTNVALSTEN